MEVNNNISNTSYTDNAIEYTAIKKNTVEDIVVAETKEYQPQEDISITKSRSIGRKDIPQIPGDVAKAIITEINKKINRNTSAEFAFHKQTNRVMITIKDSETGEVIREIPPEKTLDMIGKIWELAGILVDDKR